MRPLLDDAQTADNLFKSTTDRLNLIVHITVNFILVSKKQTISFYLHYVFSIFVLLIKYTYPKSLNKYDIIKKGYLQQYSAVNMTSYWHIHNVKIFLMDENQYLILRMPWGLSVGPFHASEMRASSVILK